MADLNINTTSAGYLNVKQKLKDVRDALRPAIKKFNRLTPEQQQAWIDNDDLVAETIDFCEKVAKRADV